MDIVIDVSVRTSHFGSMGTGTKNVLTQKISATNAKILASNV